jgi:hypothetical protein
MAAASGIPRQLSALPSPAEAEQELQADQPRAISQRGHKAQQGREIAAMIARLAAEQARLDASRARGKALSASKGTTNTKPVA